MQIGNPVALDAARHALRDAFDAAWMAETEKTSLGQRAAHCAVLLSNSDYAHHRRANSVIGRGWRRTAPDIMIAEASAGPIACHSTAILNAFGDDIAKAFF